MKTRTLKQIAKTELHCHLDGSLSFEAIRRLGEMAGIAVPASDEELAQLVRAPQVCESLLDYLTAFDFVRPLLQTKEALTLAAYDVAAQAARENVLYIEVRFAPEFSMDKGLMVVECIEAVCDGLRRAQVEFGIIAKALVCGMRQSNQELTARILSEADEVADQEFVGFDIAGDEHHFSPDAVAPLLRQLKASSRPMTIHAGECGCPTYIAQALRYDIQRMGHVTALAHQAALLEKFVVQGVVAELCLTSNLQTKAAQTVADFPYLALQAAGGKITINTDNRTVSDTNLTKEYALYADYFGATVADFYRHNQTAIEASFASPAEKAQLLTQLENSYAAYL